MKNWKKTNVGRYLKSRPLEEEHQVPGVAAAAALDVALQSLDDLEQQFQSVQQRGRNAARNWSRREPRFLSYCNLPNIFASVVSIGHSLNVTSYGNGIFRPLIGCYVASTQ